MSSSKSLATVATVAAVATVATVATATPVLSLDERCVAMVRVLAARPLHSATAPQNRTPGKRASRIASAVNDAVYRDPTTGIAPCRHTGASILGLMAREGITLA